MKTKMKKVFCLLLALLMVLSVASCGSKDDGAANDGGAANGTTGGDTGAADSGKTDAGDAGESDKPAADQVFAQTGETWEKMDSSIWTYDTTLNVAMNAEPVCLVYEYNVMTKPDFNIVRLVHSALFEYDQNSEIVPMLAESYEWVDNLHIRIKLREGVMSYGGNELTADDVLWNLQVGEENGGAANFTTYFSAAESSVEDKYTVVVGLSKSNPDIFRAFTETYIVSKADVEALGGLQAASLNPQCNYGRYNFKEWVPGQYVLLERNENYWGKDLESAGGYYQYIKLSWISDSASRVMAVQSGNVDMALGLGYADCAGFVGSTELTVVGKESSRCVGLAFNCAEGMLFNDVNLRSAIYELIDPVVCAQIMYGGYSETTDIFCATTASWYVPGLDPDRAVDVDKAKEYLAAAGCPDGFSFTLTLEPDDALKQVAEYLQAQFLEVGINMEINSPELSDYFNIIYAGESQVFMTQSGRFIDVGQAVQAWDGRISYASCGGGCGVQDQEIMDLCDIIYSSIDEAEIKDAYTRIAQKVFDEHYTIGICNGVNYILTANDITGFVIGQNGNDHLQFMHPVEA